MIFWDVLLKEIVKEMLQNESGSNIILKVKENMFQQRVICCNIFSHVVSLDFKIDKLFQKFIFQVNSWEELEVISALSKDQTNGNDNLEIVPTTKVSFVGRQYRFVFCLDITPSLATVVIIIFTFFRK